MEKFTKVQFKAGQIIFAENDPCAALFVIQKGQVEVFRTMKDSPRILLGIVGSGEYLGELGIVNEHPYHSATAMALTEIEAIRIPVDVINEQLKNVPSWLLALTRGLGSKLRRVNEVLRRNGVVDAQLETAVLSVLENTPVPPVDGKHTKKK